MSAKSLDSIVAEGQIPIDIFQEDDGSGEEGPVLLTFEDHEDGSRLNRWLPLTHTEIPGMDVPPLWCLDRFVVVEDQKLMTTFWDHRHHMIEIAQDKGLI